MKEMVNVPCAMVQDLLPLYMDGITSEESNVLIKEHMHDCHDCQLYYEKIKQDQLQLVNQQTAKFADLKTSITIINIKRIIKTVCTVLILVPLLVVSFNSVINRGTTYASLIGSWKINRAMDAIIKQDYQEANRYLDYHGFNEDRSNRNRAWIPLEKARMEQKFDRFDDSHTIVSARIEYFVGEEAFTSGYVLMDVEDNLKQIHTVRIELIYTHGKLCVVNVYPKANEASIEANNIAEQLQQILYSYDPG